MKWKFLDKTWRTLPERFRIEKISGRWRLYDAAGGFYSADSVKEAKQLAARVARKAG